MFDEDDIEAAFERCEKLIQGDVVLSREYEASPRQFFTRGIEGSRHAGDDLARRRHLEWFLLERTSPSLGTLVVEHLAEKFPDASGFSDAALFQLFFSSHAGIFEVTGVDLGQGVWMRDLASQGEYPVVEPQASSLLQVGDLIAGRLFPIGDGLHRMSRAAAFFRNATLLEAMRSDLARAREGRRGSLRISQSEIETTFYGREMRREPADPVGEARALLLAGGVERAQVEEWLEVLAQEPFDSTRILQGADDILGAILDELAFESGVDLDGARRALIRAWQALSESGPGRGASLRPHPPAFDHVGAGTELDIARIVHEIETRRKRGVPIEPLLAELETKLTDEVADEDGESDDAPVPDFPGVVGAMIDEFLWEIGLDAGSERAQDLARIKSFGRFAQNVGVFENLGVQELLTYTCFWLSENDELRNADDARALLAALQSFCRWAEDVHEVPLFTSFKSTFSSLASSLPRITEANRRRTRAADRAQGELYEIVRIGMNAERALVRDRRGAESEAIIEFELAEWLRSEDRLRARRLDDGRLAVYCCYPPESRALVSR